MSHNHRPQSWCGFNRVIPAALVRGCRLPLSYHRRLVRLSLMAIEGKVSSSPLTLFTPPKKSAFFRLNVITMATSSWRRKGSSKVLSPLVHCHTITARMWSIKVLSSSRFWFTLQLQCTVNSLIAARNQVKVDSISWLCAQWPHFELSCSVRDKWCLLLIWMFAATCLGQSLNGISLIHIQMSVQNLAGMGVRTGKTLNKG